MDSRVVNKWTIVVLSILMTCATESILDDSYCNARDKTYLYAYNVFKNFSLHMASIFQTMFGRVLLFIILFSMISQNSKISLSQFDCSKIEILCGNAWSIRLWRCLTITMRDFIRYSLININIIFVV